MSKNSDDKIVRMKFDNASFEKGVAQTIETLKLLKDNLNFPNVVNGVDNVIQKIPGIGSVLDQTLRNMTNAVTGFVQNTLSQFDSLKGIQAGFSEYETQINAVQTILANTQKEGTTIEDVNGALDELNTYADKTIYNFTEMTRNIGTFTAAGVDLKTSTEAIQGIANLAAVSGSNSEQASRAMYQLSQALASGKVTLQDWNSVVNAGMGGQMFQDALKDTAKHMGIVIDETKSFRDSISKAGGNESWLTSEVLLETLKKFSGTMSEADLKAKGYTKSQISEIMKLGQTAEDAATKVKTFTQLIDTLKESIQSGWTQSWEYVIGDFEEAKEMWTKVSDTIQDFLQPSIQARNDILKYWAEGAGQSEKEIKEIEKKQKEMYDVVKRTMAGEFGNGTKRVEAYKKMGYDPKEVQGYVNEYVKGSIKSFSDIKLAADKSAKGVTKAWTGRQYIFDALRNAGTTLVKVINAITEAFRDIFPRKTGQELTEMSKGFWDLTNRMAGVLNNEKVLKNITSTFKGFFSILDIGIKIVKGFASGITALFKAIIGNTTVSSMLETTASIGDAITAFNNYLEKTQIIEKAFTKVGTVIGTIVNKIVTAIKNLFAAPDEKGASKVNTLADAILTFAEAVISGSSIPDALENMSFSFKDFGDTLSRVGDSVKAAFGNLWDFLSPMLSNIGGGIKDFVGNINLDSLLSLITQGGLIAVLTKLFDILKGVKDLFSGAKSIGESIKDTLESVSDGVEAFQNTAKAGILQVIAKSVLMLAISIVALAYIPVENLVKGLIAFVVVIAALVGAVQLIKDKDLTKAAGGINTLGTAILKLAIAVKILSTIDAGAAFAGGVILALLTAALGAIAKKVENTNMKAIRKLAGTMIIMALAVDMLTIPLVAFSLIPWDKMKVGLFAVVVVMAALVVAVIALEKSMKNAKGNVLTNMISMVGLLLGISAAVDMLLIPVLALSLIPWDKLKYGLLAVGLVMAGLIVTILILEASIKKGGKQLVTGMMSMVGIFISLSVAIDLLLIPVLALSLMPWDKLKVGLFSVILMMAALVIAIKALQAGNLNKSALGLITLVAPLIAIAAAINLLLIPVVALSMVPWDKLKVGLFAVVVIMAALVVAIIALSKATKKMKVTTILGIVAILAVMSIAVAVLMQSIVNALSNVTAGDLIIGFAAIAGAILVLVAAFAALSFIASKLTSTTIAGLQTFALVLASIGVAAAGIGVLIWAIIDAVEALNTMQISPDFIANVQLVAMAIGIAIQTALQMAIQTILSLIPTVVLTLLSVVDLFLSGLNERLGSILESLFGILTQILTAICTFIQNNIGMLVETVLVVVVAILEGLEKHMQEIVEALIGIIVGMINGVANKLDDIIKSIINFIQKLADSLEKRKTEIAKAISDFLMSVLDVVLATLFGKEGIMKKLPEMGKKILAGVISGLIDAFNMATGFLGDLLDTIVNTVIGWINNIPGVNIEEKTWGADIAAKIHIDTPGWVSDALSGLATGGVIKGKNSDHIVGEAGPELLSTRMGKTQVTPLTHQNTRSVLDGYVYKMDHRLADISDSLDSINSGFNNYKTNSNKFDYDDSGILAKMETMEETMSGLGNKIEGMSVVINGDALVGQISKPMDRALGKIAQRKVR